MTTGNMPEQREGDKSMERTEDEIERTIDDLHETVGVLRERLSPDHIKTQVTHSIRDATVGKAERTMNKAKYRAEHESAGFVETVKQNPLPAAMAAFGIGWLLFNKKEPRNGHGNWPDESGRRGHGPDRWDEHSSGYQAPYGWGGGSWEQRESSRRSAGMGPDHLAQRAGETAEDFRRRTGEMAETAKERVGEMAGAAQERVEEMGDRAQQMMGDFSEQARYQARNAGSEFEKMWYQNPMGMAAVAFGVGAAVGLMLPETEKERELMGETRDKLAEQAGGMIEQGAQQAREQVERTLQGQPDEQRPHGGAAATPEKSTRGTTAGSTASSGRQGTMAGTTTHRTPTTTTGQDSEAVPDGRGTGALE